MNPAEPSSPNPKKRRRLFKIAVTDKLRTEVFDQRTEDPT